MTFEHILVAVDFSEESEVAVQQAMVIARQHGAKITLVHAGMVPEPPVGLPESMQPVLTEYMTAVEAHLAADRERLADLRTRYAGQGVDIGHAVHNGRPDDAIVAAARELGADLIATGSHGRTGWRRFLMGSVAEKVVRNADASVIVARAPENEVGQVGDVALGPARRILVPTDFSRSAAYALEVALSLAGPDTLVTLLHCWYLAPFSYPHYAAPATTTSSSLSMRESLVANAGKLGTELVERHADKPCDLDFQLVEASAAAGVQDWLAEHSTDLVVMGSHGWRGATRWLLGSVAEQTVRHAPCSVLVVHPPADAATE